MVFKARNGILHTEQLTMESPLLRVQGSGHIDLPAQKMDLRLETMVVNTSTGQAGKELAELSGIGIPILLTGALQQPTVKPDLTVLVSLGSFGLQALKERLGPSKPAADPSSEADSENKNEILDGIGKRLGEGLRSLF
jgi:AsmA protein